MFLEVLDSEIDELKQRLAKNRGENVFAREFLHESKLWIEHIDHLNSQYCVPQNMYRSMFILNDMISNLCTVLNWLTCVSKLKDRVTNAEIGSFICRNFHWPEHIGETFMNCIRNPSVHLGRAAPWGEYRANWSKNEAYHGGNFTFYGSVVPNTSELSLGLDPINPKFERIKKYALVEGFAEFQSQPDFREVHFFFPGLLSHTIRTICSVYDTLCTSNDGERKKFEGLRNSIEITRVAAPENMGL